MRAALVGLAALCALTARAQVSVSSGPSLPMLEFTGGTHPVSFAPGIGYELSFGFAQFAWLTQQWDALDLSVQLFGNALASQNGDPAGSLQVAACVGTLNNVLAIGAAVPLYGGPGGGAFQGSTHVYPVLSINIPVEWAPYSPPVGIQEGPGGLPRGGTLYLGGPTTARMEPAAAERLTAPSGQTPAQEAMHVPGATTPAEQAAARMGN